MSYLCRYGKRTHGIFEKLGIPGSKPVLYFGTAGQHDRVRTQITEILITETRVCFQGFVNAERRFSAACQPGFLLYQVYYLDDHECAQKYGNVWG